MINEKLSVYKICKVILPFLIVKKDVCHLILDAYEDTFKNIHPSEYDFKKREVYYQRTLVLNYVGKKEKI